MSMIQNSSQKSGFTLVEIAVAMMIIGLLIGGVLGAKKMRESAQAMDIIKSLALYESSAIKFREIYGELPGDIRDPAARLTNCNAVPCTRVGNGDGILDSAVLPSLWYDDLSVTDERFVFWNHLLTAGLITGFKGMDDMNFGEGQPQTDIGPGYRVATHNFANLFGFYRTENYHLFLIGAESSIYAESSTKGNLKCEMIAKIDRKIDDGLFANGKVHGHTNCSTISSASAGYDRPNSNAILKYLARF